MIDIDIYSKNGCIYCDKSKSFLYSRGYTFTEHCLDSGDIEYLYKRDLLFDRYQQRSFPIIVINNVFIGGYTQLMHYNFPLKFDESF
jgi:glutaredoxin